MAFFGQDTSFMTCECGSGTQPSSICETSLPRAADPPRLHVLVIVQGNVSLPGERDSTSDFLLKKISRKRAGSVSCPRLARVAGSAAPRCHPLAAPAPHRSRGKELGSCSVRPAPSLRMHLPSCLLSCCTPVQHHFPAFPSLSLSAGLSNRISRKQLLAQSGKGLPEIINSFPFLLIGSAEAVLLLTHVCIPIPQPEIKEVPPSLLELCCGSSCPAITITAHPQEYSSIPLHTQEQPPGVNTSVPNPETLQVFTVLQFIL